MQFSEPGTIQNSGLPNFTKYIQFFQIFDLILHKKMSTNFGDGFFFQARQYCFAPRLPIFDKTFRDSFRRLIIFVFHNKRYLKKYTFHPPHHITPLNDFRTVVIRFSIYYSHCKFCIQHIQIQVPKYLRCAELVLCRWDYIIIYVTIYLAKVVLPVTPEKAVGSLFTKKKTTYTS